MKKILLTASLVFSLLASYAQIDSANNRNDTLVTATPATTPAPRVKDWKNMDLSNRSNDHFLLQYGLVSWTGNPDSISPKGFSRQFNIYFMLDKPFRTNPHYSVGIGVGVSSDNVFFKKTYVNVKSNSTLLPFTDVDSADHFKKFKLSTTYVEVPVELRFNSDPLNSNKSFKIALGAKVGTPINVHTKGKTLQNKADQTINAYIMKENSKKFFNSTRLAATARIGYGIISVYGTYQVTGLLKDEAGPVIRPYAVGLTLSGL
jgi:hypothetical protein